MRWRWARVAKLALVCGLLASGGVVAVAGAPAGASTPLKIVSNVRLPNGTALEEYHDTLVASGGTAPYTWSLTGGSLPTGLGLTSSGTVEGFPLLPNDSATFTLTVRDSSSPVQTVSQTFWMDVWAPGGSNVTQAWALTLGALLTDVPGQAEIGQLFVDLIGADHAQGTGTNPTLAAAVAFVEDELANIGCQLEAALKLGCDR